MKKFAQWMALVFATVIALAIAAHSILTWMTRAGRDASVARLQARLTSPARIGESRSPGTAPATFPTIPPTTPSPELIASWQKLFATWEARAKDEGFKKRWETFLDITLRVRWGDRHYYELTGEELEALTAFLEESADILESIRALTQPEMPACEFDAYSQTNLHWVFDVLLSANILLSTAQGSYGSVPLDLTALLKMCDADAFVAYPFIMGNGMEQCLNDALINGAVPDAPWQVLLAQLEASRDHALFTREWKSLAGHWLRWYQDLPASGTDVTNPPILGQVLGLGYAYAGTPLLNHNLDTYSNVMDQLLELAPQPYYRAKPDLDRIQEEDAIPPPWELMPWQLEPGIWLISTAIHERFAERGNTEAHIDMARLAILLEQHRAQSGTYPESLDAVAEAFGRQIPINPLTGEPFQYALEDDAFRLWYRDTYQDDEGHEHAAINTWPGQREDLGPIE